MVKWMRFYALFAQLESIIAQLSTPTYVVQIPKIAPERIE